MKKILSFIAMCLMTLALTAQSQMPPQQPMESRFNFKHIIDEVFGELDGNVRPLDKGMKRPETMVELVSGYSMREDFKNS